MIFTIHDLIHLKVSAESSIGKRVYYETVVKRAAMRAARVLTVSEFARCEVLEWTGLSEERVEVVGNGISEAFRKDGPVRRCPWPYFLFVGNRKPHKNLTRVLEAFARSGLSRQVRLALTGNPDGGTLGMAAKLRISHAVEFLGCISDLDLAACYRGAVALVAPSLYEGFCIPAVEALACGCPVLAGAAAQIEVLGDAGMFVSPKKVDDIASAMLTLMAPRTREPLMALGFRRCQLYSWDRTADKVLTALGRDANRDRSRVA